MDIKGKTIVITGATSGLGQAAAIDFAGAGAKIFIVGRDAARANETLAAARAAGGAAEVILGDVSPRAGVKAVAAALLAQTATIDVLVNNAGGTFKTFTRTADGVETTFALNTLGAFLLEKELHGALKAAHGRIVNLTTGFLNSFTVDVDDLSSPRKYSGFNQYGRAKLAVVMMTIEQAKRFETDGIKVNALHPGIIMGTRFGGGQPKVMQMLGGPLMRAVGFACSLEEAVRRFRVACFDDAIPTGAYVVKGRSARLPKQASQESVRTRLMALLDRSANTGASSRLS